MLVTHSNSFFKFKSQRCSSLERPLSATGLKNATQAARQCPSPIPAHVAKGIGLSIKIIMY